MSLWILKPGAISSSAAFAGVSAARVRVSRKKSGVAVRRLRGFMLGKVMGYEDENRKVHFLEF